MCYACGSSNPEYVGEPTIVSKNTCSVCLTPYPTKKCHHCGQEFWYNPKNFDSIPNNCQGCQKSKNQKNQATFPTTICHHCGGEFWYDPKQFNRPPTNCATCHAKRHPY